jgi:hypothetical protein
MGTKLLVGEEHRNQTSNIGTSKRLVLLLTGLNLSRMAEWMLLLCWGNLNTTPIPT